MIIKYLNIFIILITLILLIKCDYNDSKDISNESYSVYSAVIDSFFSNSEIKLVKSQSYLYQIAVDKKEFIDLNVKIYSKWLSQKHSIAVENYFKNMENNSILKNKFSSKVPVKLISDNEMKGERIIEIIRKHPESNGILTFSLVGFNEKKTEAFLYIENFRGGLDAFGGYVYLVKIDSKWKVKKYDQTWIA